MRSGLIITKDFLHFSRLSPLNDLLLQIIFIVTSSFLKLLFFSTLTINNIVINFYILKNLRHRSCVSILLDGRKPSSRISKQWPSEGLVPFGASEHFANNKGAATYGWKSSGVPFSVEKYLVLHCYAAQLAQPNSRHCYLIRKTTTNPASLAHVFPRVALDPRVYFQCWLVHCIVRVVGDWPEWSLWFWFYEIKKACNHQKCEQSAGKVATTECIWLAEQTSSF